MRPASVPAAGPVAEPARPVSLADRLAGWRNRLVASPRFQRFAASFPLTRPIAQRQSQALFDLCAGFVYAQVLQACVQLDLFRILDEAPPSAAESMVVGVLRAARQRGGRREPLSQRAALELSAYRPACYLRSNRYSGSIFEPEVSQTPRAACKATTAVPAGQSIAARAQGLSH